MLTVKEKYCFKKTLTTGDVYFWSITLQKKTNQWLVTSYLESGIEKKHEKETYFTTKRAANDFIKDEINNKKNIGYSFSPYEEPDRYIGTRKDIEIQARKACQSIKNSIPAGVKAEVIVTVIIPNEELIQETLK